MASAKNRRSGRFRERTLEGSEGSAREVEAQRKAGPEYGEVQYPSAREDGLVLTAALEVPPPSSH